MHSTHEPRSHQQHRVEHHARHLYAYDFFNLLTGDALLERVDQHLPPHRERLYPPIETLSLFMAQTLDPDRACQHAVNRYAVDRIANGLKPCSTHTGGYCRARQRLPLDMIRSLARETGQQITRQAQASWRWLGRPVKLVDGTTVTLPDTRINQDFLAARLDVVLARTLLASLEASRPFRLLPDFNVDAVRLAAEQRQLDGRHGELRAKLEQLDAEITRRDAELRSTRELVEKLVQTAPIARQRAQDYKDLLEKNFVSRHGYLEREQARIEQERDLAAQQAKLEEIRAALLESQRQRASLIAETRRATLDVLNLAEQKVASLSQDLVKAENRGRLMRLTAPVGGTVQQLAVHTVGGVVTPAQALLVIVPGDNPLEIEAFVENKDIGFVRAGQMAEVKVETFPFTKYGTLHGKVMQVSSDAIQDEKRGLVYAARVKLEKTTLKVDGKTVNLTPGMAVTVEIKTGKRRVIEYFLSPLMQYGDESLRER
jgi:hemolysin D